MRRSRAAARVGKALKPVVHAVLGAATVSVLRGVRRFDPHKTANFGARCARMFGPLLKEQRIGRTNLRAAFPEKTDAEIDAILAKVWDNLGRFGGEFAHLDRIWDFDPAHPEKSRIELPQESIATFEKLLADGKGALIFSAHLGNWELPALAAPAYGLDSAVLFRRPNIAAVDRAVQDIRAVNMGQMIATSLDAPVRLADALQRGLHVGMLVDQHYSKGVDVTFFGRPAKANPLLARLARQIECPIHGTRIVRLPGDRFRAEITDEVEPVRDANGAIDVQGTTQKINAIIEGWIREHPEQWLWLHRRWR
ncbi:lipid A biosynthesis lauroyl acyltransferase [Bradyrhizobium sp. LHD-71]|uniref:lipid A biosynthesis lauroyl acyltransferase n=1 Tax=Bradyrhizobium sp. LHD-71 TaxID=3072141 RepID=UPI00280DCCD1|nr:lipid A biosynthesis lauroyl acyltransferase [Bradyrhizobium sp. LHD-71]MDQ8728660.1 lipid A biosynthesis lauroyl acyltransferase [Bradyrhizobium sp. LHD-71]